MTRRDRFLFLLALLFLLPYPHRARTQTSELVPKYDEKSKLWGFSKPNMLDMAIAGEFDSCGKFPPGAPALVVKDNRYFYVNRLGKPAFEKRFEFAGEFRNGLAPVKIDGKFGMITAEGRVAIDPAYVHLGSHRESRIRFREGPKFGYLNTRGEKVIAAEFDLVGEFSNGKAWFRREGKFGYLNTDGKVVVDATYEAADDFAHGLAAVRKGDKFGFINPEGRLAIETQFDAVRPFRTPSIGNATLAAVKRNGKWGVIDRTGKLLCEYEAEGLVETEDFLGLRTGDLLAVVAGVSPTTNTLLMEKRTAPEQMQVEIKSKPIPVEVYVVDKFTFDSTTPETLLTPMNRLTEGDPSDPPRDDPTVTARLNKNKTWVILFVKRQADGTPKIEWRPCRPAVDSPVKVEFP
jgi:WG containing repeat